MNRLAISGGTYKDWVEVQFDEEVYMSATSPVYMGGMSRELVFQEVISNSGSNSNGGEQPLGTLAGRGIMGSRHKGGKIMIKCNEPCYLIGLTSATPRIDYAQGNRWDVTLSSYADLHVPSLDQIGFQELIAEKMAWWTTSQNTTTGEWIQQSIGKQPAWLDYMTNYNRVFGNFAIENNQGFMVFQRNYEPTFTGANKWEIRDATTYIDPAKFNHIFAQASLDSQNLWMQIAVNMTVRRRMSAKMMPNL